jgi:hypothetical protein
VRLYLKNIQYKTGQAEQKKKKKKSNLVWRYMAVITALQKYGQEFQVSLSLVLQAISENKIFKIVLSLNEKTRISNIPKTTQYSYHLNTNSSFMNCNTNLFYINIIKAQEFQTSKSQITF